MGIFIYVCDGVCLFMEGSPHIIMYVIEGYLLGYAPPYLFYIVNAT